MNRRDAVRQLTSGCLAGPWLTSQSLTGTTRPANVSTSSVNGQIPLPGRAEVVANAIRMMEENGVHKDPVYGTYFSGYGEGLFTVESYFDNIALFYAGNVELGKNGLRIPLARQQENGFIPVSPAQAVSVALDQRLGPRLQWIKRVGQRAPCNRGHTIRPGGRVALLLL